MTFVDEDGNELQSSQVRAGDMPAYTGATPTKDGDAQYTYEFSGWTPELVEATEDATYTATYAQTVNQYTVKFVNWDGAILQNSQLAYGAMPEYAGETPTRATDAQNSYEFSGWDPEVAEVTGDATYTAAFAATPVKPTDKWSRLAGTDRYKTMAEIVEHGFEAADCGGWAIVATGDNFPDALVASSLAGVKGCPVILTSGKSLSAAAREQLERLGVTNVYVMGSEAAVSKDVWNELKRMGITPERVQGTNRQLTSLDAFELIDELTGGVDTVVIAKGSNYPDVLSIGPWCYKTGTPILLTNNDLVLVQEQVDALRAAGVRHVILLGDENGVSSEVMSQLDWLTSDDFTRLSGSNRYETSARIVQWELEQGMSLANVAVATGNNFPDALAGAAMCGAGNNVLFLVGDGSAGLSAADAVLDATGAPQVVHGYVLGGEPAVDKKTFQYLVSLTA